MYQIRSHLPHLLHDAASSRRRAGEAVVGMAGSAEENRNGTRPAVGVLADQPPDNDHDDRLGYSAFADALAELIDDPETDTPLTIAISAPWGAGKTTLARLVERRLQKWPEERGEAPHITCWFDAWMHDDNPHLGSALAAEISKQANKHRTTFRRFAKPRPSTLLSPDQRVQRRLLLLGGILIAALATTCLTLWGKSVLRPIANEAFDDKFSKIGKFHGYELLPVGVFLIFIILTSFFSIFQMCAVFVKHQRKETAVGHTISERLGRFLQEVRGGKRKVVIFVDDLERCRPPRALEACEIASQLLSHPGVVTVLIADMASVATCADVKYGPLEGRYPLTDTQGVGREDSGEPYGAMYLQKIVQIQFDLPVPPVGAMRRLVNSLPIHETSHEPAGGSPERVRAPESLPVGQGKRTLDVASRYGWKIALGLLFISFILVIVLPVNDVTNEILGAALSITFVAVLIFSVIRIVLAVKRYLRRSVGDRKKKSIDERAEEDAQRDDCDVGQPTTRVESQSGKVVHGLATQRAQRYLTDKSPLRQQANEELLQFPPPLPQAAKRTLNLLRVLLTVAVRRGMLGGHPDLSVRHLAKWALLMSRWPELATTLRAAPKEMATLEAAAGTDGLEDRLRELNYRRPITEELLVVLQSSTKLAPVMTRLVAYEPVSEDAGRVVGPSLRRAGGGGEFGEVEVDRERLGQV